MLRRFWNCSCAKLSLKVLSSRLACFWSLTSVSTDSTLANTLGRTSENVLLVSAINASFLMKRHRCLLTASWLSGGFDLVGVLYYHCQAYARSNMSG